MNEAIGDTKLGQFLTLRDFCTCTNTYKRFADQIDPYPQNPEETIPSLAALCEHILDPIISEFGIARFKLTYGLCSPDLKKWLAKKDPVTGVKYGMTTPGGDQHMSHERNSKGGHFCARLGASCDFRILDFPSDDLITRIISRRLPFDAIYFYGPERPIHISHGPQNKRYICTFSNKVPTLKGTEHWRKMLRT
jgi:hypothetical protein